MVCEENGELLRLVDSKEKQTVNSKAPDEPDNHHNGLKKYCLACFMLVLSTVMRALAMATAEVHVYYIKCINHNLFSLKSYTCYGPYKEHVPYETGALDK